MNKFTKISLAAVAALSFTSVAIADDKLAVKADSMQNQITKQDLKNSPELGDTIQVSSASPSLKCLVDTRKWDRWGSPRCMSADSATSATVYFSIVNPPSNRTIYWSDSRCNNASTTCALPIRGNQTVILNADVIDRNTNMVTPISASAEYINTMW